MATAITTTGQDITNDFDLVVRGSPTSRTSVTVLKSLGTGSTNWVTLATIQVPTDGSFFVKNTGTNAYKLAASVSSVTVEFQQ